MSASTEDLEKRLENDRASLRETLSAIEGKMSPGRMIDEAMSYFETGPKEFATLLGSQAKANPLPLLLTGVGLAWLILGDRTAASVSSEPNRAPDADKSPELDDDDYEVWDAHDRIAAFELDFSRFDNEPYDEWRTRLHAGRAAALNLQPTDGEDDAGFRDRIAETAAAVRSKSAAIRDRMRERLAKTRTAAGQAVHSGQDAVEHAAGEVRDKSKAAITAALQLHESNPMATAALGVALGAFLGAIVPQSRQEEKALGDVADKGLETVAEAATKVAAGVKTRLDPEGSAQQQA